jgi:hypothetical protein
MPALGGSGTGTLTRRVRAAFSRWVRAAFTRQWGTGAGGAWHFRGELGESSHAASNLTHVGQIEPKHRSTLCARPPSRPTSVANIRPKLENVQNRRNVRFLKKSVSVPKIRTCWVVIVK